MKKSTLLKSIDKCISACENLATSCTQSDDYKMCSDCLGKAIDCADAGMILLIKLGEDDGLLHRNLLKQYISYCKACTAACSKYDNYFANSARERCKTSIEACEKFVSQHIDQYSFIPKTPSYLLDEEFAAF